LTDRAGAAVRLVPLAAGVALVAFALYLAGVY
jgi:hypothetical protein